MARQEEEEEEDEEEEEEEEEEERGGQHWGLGWLGQAARRVDGVQLSSGSGSFSVVPRQLSLT